MLLLRNFKVTFIKRKFTSMHVQTCNFSHSQELFPSSQVQHVNIFMNKMTKL